MLPCSCSPTGPQILKQKLYFSVVIIGFLTYSKGEVQPWPRIQSRTENNLDKITVILKHIH